MTVFNALGAFFVLYVTLSSAEKLTTQEETSRESLRKLGLANNELAFNLFRTMASGSSGNVFFSPFSISMVFGLLFYGTRGETAEELRKSLGYEKANLTDELVSESFSRYFSEVLKSGNSSDGSVLNAANSVLVDKKIKLLEEYRSDVQKLYKADVRDVDFAGENSRVVKEINTWVEEKTNGKIEKLVNRLSPGIVFMLLNVVYFKGVWKHPFGTQRTKEAIFYNKGKEESSVQMMYLAGYFAYASVDDFQVLELPYKGGNACMLIFLPNQRDGMKDLEENLTLEKLAHIQRQLHFRRVDIWLPKFKLQYKIELSKNLKALGFNQIFRTEADFSGMTPKRGLGVDEIIHDAVIEVNEKGTEAAAATRMGMRKSKVRNYPRFRADHPFLFAIVEKGSSSNMILFMGRVNSL